jgi:hypothetical protein
MAEAPKRQIVVLINQIDELFNDMTLTPMLIASRIESMESKYGRDVVRAACIASHLVATRQRQFSAR